VIVARFVVVLLTLVALCATASCPGRPASTANDDNGVVAAGEGEGEGASGGEGSSSSTSPREGFVGGGPIDGEVTIEAFDADLGEGARGMFVFTGVDGHPSIAALTDERGIAHLVDPTLAGPQTITIGGGCWETVTFVDVDARELRVPLRITGRCGVPDSGGPPPRPSTLSGRVLGFDQLASQLSLDRSGCAGHGACEVVAAIVTVSSTSPVNTASPIADGSVFVATEGAPSFRLIGFFPSRVALVAIAGALDLNTGTLRRAKLGVRRAVRPIRAGGLDHEDITLATTLDRTTALTLENLPLEQEDVLGQPIPNVARVDVFLDLGDDGFAAIASAVDAGDALTLSALPDGAFDYVVTSGAVSAAIGNSGGTVDVNAGSRVVTGSAGIPWDQRGPLGFVDAAFVVARPDGSQFVARTLARREVGGALELVLDRDVDFTGTSLPYGTDITTGAFSIVHTRVTGAFPATLLLGPHLALPVPSAPVDEGVLLDRTFRWNHNGVRAPDLQELVALDPFTFEVVWRVYVDGTRSSLRMPVMPTLDALRDAMPADQSACLDEPHPQSCDNALRYFGAGEPPLDMLVGGGAVGVASFARRGFDPSSFAFDEDGVVDADASAGTELTVFINPR
jgi:hypothetical protein